MAPAYYNKILADVTRPTEDLLLRSLRLREQKLRGFCVNLLREVNVFIGTISRFARYQSGSKLGTG